MVKGKIRVQYQEGEVNVWLNSCMISSFDVAESNDADRIVRMFEQLGYEVTSHIAPDVESLDNETCKDCGELFGDCECGYEFNED